MNRNDFFNMLSDPGLTDRQAIGEVYELINIFPYFQSAHLLLLKCLYSTSDIKFENQLRLSALHVGDREILYWLLNKKTEPVSKETISVEPVPGNVDDVESETDTTQNVIEAAKNSELLIGEIEKDKIEAQENIGGEEHHTHAILVPEEADEEPDIIQPVGVMYLPDEESLNDNVFYMDPGFSLPEELPEDNDLLELDLDTPEEQSSDLQIIPERKSTRDLQSELIDKFIFANPRIEPVRDKSDEPNIDISKPYTEAREGLVSETLAKIYIKQGYYSKAIDIYEKLSLKFPEKSSYFASQIEKVKDYIKK
jgi:hypothetical protein